MRHAILFKLLSVAVTFTLLYSLTFIPRRLVRLSPDEITKIQIIKGETGEKVIVTDNEEIKQLVDDLNRMMIRKVDFRHIKGFSYSIYLYNQQGKLIKNITFCGNKVIQGAFSYRIAKGEIDFGNLEGSLI